MVDKGVVGGHSRLSLWVHDPMAVQANLTNVTPDVTLPSEVTVLR